MENDPEKVTRLMSDLRDSEAWSVIVDVIEQLEKASMRQICDTDCKIDDVNFYRGIIAFCRALCEGPTNLITQATRVIEENERRVETRYMPERKYPPRGL